MCSSCCPDDTNNEEYYTAFSDFETSTPEVWRTPTRLSPEDWRTSTRLSPEDWRTSTRFSPEYIKTPQRPVQRDYQRTRLKNASRRADITSGVAVIPRRIDFDAVSDVGTDVEEDELGETLRRLRGTVRPIPESTAASGVYRLSTTRATQYPSNYRTIPG